MDVVKAAVLRFVQHYLAGVVTPEAVATEEAAVKAKLEQLVASTPTKADDVALHAAEAALDGPLEKELAKDVFDFVETVAAGNEVVVALLPVFRSAFGV